MTRTLDTRIRDFLRRVFKRKRVLLAFMAGTMGGVLLLGMLLFDPVYRAEAQILIEPGPEHLFDPALSTSGVMRPVMSFVQTTERVLIAAFPQPALRFIQLGDPVEVALKRFPGQILTGRVKEMVPATGQG